MNPSDVTVRGNAGAGGASLDTIELGSYHTANANLSCLYLSSQCFPLCALASAVFVGLDQVF